MASRVKILVEVGSEPLQLIYLHTTFNIPYRYTTPIIRPVRKEGPMWFELPEIGKVIVERMFQIEGVSDITISPYCITVRRGRLFSSEVILGHIDQALRDIFKDDLDLISG